MDWIWSLIGTASGVIGAVAVAFFSARFTAQNEQRRLREEKAHGNTEELWGLLSRNLEKVR